MWFCYIDESGTPENPGNTSHFVLLGIAIPAIKWKENDAEIQEIKRRFALEDTEIHSAWMARRYREQEKIAGFEKLPAADRRQAVQEEMKKTLLYTQATGSPGKLKTVKKSFRNITPFVHLTREERLAALRCLCDVIGRWTDCRLFAEAIDKTAARPGQKVDYKDAFEQLLTRFQYFLNNYGKSRGKDIHGLIIQDRNDTMAARLEELARRYHATGTRWTEIGRIVETPMFVDSKLTSMVQLLTAV